MSVEQIANTAFSAQQSEGAKLSLQERAGIDDFTNLLKDNFFTIDKNDDNKLSEDELCSSFDKESMVLISEFLTKLDLNDDNSLSLSEIDKNDKVGNSIKNAIGNLLSNDSLSKTISDTIGEFANKYIKNADGTNVFGTIANKLI